MVLVPTRSFTDPLRVFGSLLLYPPCFFTLLLLPRRRFSGDRKMIAPTMLDSDERVVMTFPVPASGER